MNHYPSTDGKTFPEGVLRIAAHTDFELLTLLFNEGGGLGLPATDAELSAALWESILALHSSLADC